MSLQLNLSLYYFVSFDEAVKSLKHKFTRRERKQMAHGRLKTIEHIFWPNKSINTNVQKPILVTINKKRESNTSKNNIRSVFP